MSGCLSFNGFSVFLRKAFVWKGEVDQETFWRLDRLHRAELMVAVGKIRSCSCTLSLPLCCLSFQPTKFFSMQPQFRASEAGVFGA